MTDAVVSPGNTPVPTNQGPTRSGPHINVNQFGQYKEVYYILKDDGTRGQVVASRPLSAAEVLAIKGSGVPVEQSNALFSIGGFEITPAKLAVAGGLWWYFKGRK